MLRDIWIYDTRSKSWTEILPGHDEQPAARGWFDTDFMRGFAKEVIVVHGGLNESNERPGGVWVLEA